MATGDADLDEKVAQWLKWDRNASTKKEIIDLVDQRNVSELKSRMSGRLAFGTAGIRAKMEAGFNRLNDLVIIQTTQGMIAHMQSECPGRHLSVAIGFDARYNSERFARLAANAFVLSGIKVHLFKKIVATPLVSYAVVKLECDAGLMITASHNPKADNGYKAYWSNGAQIISPHDEQICVKALDHLEPMNGVWDFDHLAKNDLLVDAEPMLDAYFEDTLKFNYFKSINKASRLRFAYSAFHGVGTRFTPRCVKLFGFREDSVVLVRQEAAADPDFPSMAFPNPEEGRPVFEQSIRTADTNQCNFILVNDPDADRFQLAEKQPHGEWRIYTGNEMGAVFSWWTWHGWRGANPHKNPNDVYMLTSAVSSRISKTMAKIEGFNFIETLTGFKWMGNESEKLRRRGKTVLLCWEESIGFMPGSTLDKDGVVTAAMFAECCAYLADKGLSFSEQLRQIYTKYGYHLILNSYFINRSPEVTKTLFDNIRNFTNTGTYPTIIGTYNIKNVRDLTVGYDNAQPDNKPILPVGGASEMITFTLANSSVITLRSSGTEPKIKYYIEFITEPGKQASDLNQILGDLKNLESAVIATLLQPDVYGLEWRQ